MGGRDMPRPVEDKTVGKMGRVALGSNPQGDPAHFSHFSPIKGTPVRILGLHG